MKQVYLTTEDNPYNPAVDYENWLAFDIEHGYNTCGYLARIACTSDALTDEENVDELNRAIDEIIRYNPFRPYKKIVVDE